MTVRSIILACAAAAPAHAQPGQTTVFVANNGNAEGSVTSYALNDDGSPLFIAKYVIGTTAGRNTNAYGIDVTPDGRFLAVSHATSAAVTEQLTILAVNADGTLAPAFIGSTPDSPLDLLWMSDTVLAVTRTQTSGTNEVITYRWDPSVPSLTLADRRTVPGFCAYLARHPARPWVFAAESTLNTITAFEVSPDGALSWLGSSSGGAYPLGPGVTPDGRRVYAGGGISAGRRAVVGFDLSPDSGELSPIPGTPFSSPGESPKQVAFSIDGSFALVAHGTDATIRVLSIDDASGSLSDTGQMYDVGFQGSLGELIVLGDLVLVTDRDTISDGVRGLQALRLGADGSLTPIGGRVDSAGVSPSQLCLWTPTVPSCPPDFNGDGFVDFFDFLAFIDCYEGVECPGGRSADFNDDGFVDFFDLDAFTGAFEAGC
ncbi:MAG: beta-propeller fold lactonase family protein [Phycisphaeraceae bacterium]|nr:MAG: beta-propeller fold lactonase family protein [Phycisphaeraceae bacterium]